MKNVRIAILGAGRRWQDLDPFFAMRPNLEIVAICDFAEGAAEAAAKRLCEKTGYTPAVFHRYEDMVKSAVYDACFITVDPSVQVEYAVREMARVIHVMTEVPAAYTIEQCYDLVKAVRRSGVTYMLAEPTRYWHFFEIWRRMAKEGKFGNIYYAEGSYLHYAPQWDFFRRKDTKEHVWSDDPALDNDPAWERSWRYQFFRDPILYLPHELSPLLSVTGGRIEKVSCFGSKRGDSYTKGFDVRDIECALMQNTNGCIFHLRAGFNAPSAFQKGTYGHWYQIKGTECSVEWARSELPNDNPKMYTLQDGWTEPHWPTENPNEDELYDLFKGKGHGGIDYYPIHYFVDAILNGTAPPMDVFAAVETAAPAILAAASANRGGVQLTVPDFRTVE